MKSFKLNYFLKLIFVFVLIISGLLSLFKETASYNQRSKNLPIKKKILSEKILKIPPEENNLIVQENLIANNIAGNYTIKVPILMYHHIRIGVPLTENLSFDYSILPEIFEQQLSFLKNNGFQTISLNDLYDSLQNNTPLPPKSIILTFDDGYRDFYTYAFPLLKKHNIRAVVFYPVNYSKFPAYMNWNMLAEIHNSGLIDIESHTLEHPVLTQIDFNEARREIFESKQILEQKLNKKVSYFAYPYGEYDQKIINLVKEAGYNLAFGAVSATNFQKSEQFTLPRVGISGFDSFEQFKTKLIINFQSNKN